MKPFLKILLIVVAVLVCLHFLPVLLIPVFLGVAALVMVGLAVAGGLVGVAATGITLVATVLAVALIVLAVLAPIWLPVLAVYGLVMLCRRNRKVATAV
jgi:hypothetical protein